MENFFLAQMGDFFTEDVCFHTSTEGEKGERRLHAPPFSAKGRAKGRSHVGQKAPTLDERNRRDEQG